MEGDLQIRCVATQSSHISIHALRVEGDPYQITTLFKYHKISIHALRVEGDCWKHPEADRLVKISIHALRVEGDPKDCIADTGISKFLSTPSGWRATEQSRQQGLHVPEFLSTPSGWRATTAYLRSLKGGLFLSTPSGWRATRSRQRAEAQRRAISIHALRVEGDNCEELMKQSNQISIHALRVEGDRVQKA